MTAVPRRRSKMNIAETSESKRNLIAFAATLPLAMAVLASIYAATGLMA